jgi:hypothetical protein
VTDRARGELSPRLRRWGLHQIELSAGIIAFEDIGGDSAAAVPPTRAVTSLRVAVS